MGGEGSGRSLGVSQMHGSENRIQPVAAFAAATPRASRFTRLRFVVPNVQEHFIARGHDVAAALARCPIQR